jgi:hypothetical protein
MAQKKDQWRNVMKLHVLYAGLVIPALLLGANAALSLAPGSADRKAALPNVCANGPFKHEVCDPTEVDPCGVRRSGRPYECVVDFSKRTLRGTLTLISDEEVGDNNTSFGNPTITMLMEFTDDEKRYFVAKTFQNTTAPMFPEIGHWLAPETEDEIDDVINSFVFQTPVGALEDVGEALRQVANEILGRKFDFSDTTPVIFDLDSGRGSDDDDDKDHDDGDDEAIDQYVGTNLGQVARFRIRVKFVED